MQCGGNIFSPRQVYRYYRFFAKYLSLSADHKFVHQTKKYQHKVIKTHDSELRGQEEAAIIRKTKIMWPLSELFTRKTAKKIANALAKLP